MDYKEFESNEKIVDLDINKHKAKGTLIKSYKKKYRLCYIFIYIKKIQ